MSSKPQRIIDLRGRRDTKPGKVKVSMTAGKRQASPNVKGRSPKAGAVVRAAVSAARGATTRAAVAVSRYAKVPDGTHGISGSYAGPSPTFRQTTRKLTPISTTMGVGRVTERDKAFLSDIRQRYAGNPFPRLDCDAGSVRRAIRHGWLRHVSGDMGDRDARFQLIKRGLEYGARR